MRSIGAACFGDIFLTVFIHACRVANTILAIQAVIQVSSKETEMKPRQTLDNYCSINIYNMQWELHGTK